MNTSFPSLRIEGGLLSGEMIDKIAEASSDIPGQKPVDFGLEPNRPLIDEIASAWNDARSYWALFQKSLERLKPEDPGTTLTRDRWMVPFFSLLGYNLQSQRKAAGIEGASYYISHRGGVHEQAPPIHITGFRQSLERRPESGVPRLAPHSLVQEYLNRSEELWGIVTNGHTLRLLRDSRLIRRQAYIEFDLKEVIEGERFADFALLYRLIHATRLPKGIEDADKCLLEQYYRTTVEQGGRVRDHLRDGVERALIRFGDGFLNHPKNSSFQAKVSQKEIEPFEYYQQLLRLIYRFLFLMVSEERGLISDNKLYRQYYSISRVRNLAGTAAAYNEFEDIWVNLRVTFSLFTDESTGALLQVPPLNGDLFDPSRTETINLLSLSNRELLHALWDLSMYREKDNAPWRRINYAALDVEELGSVYESLLEFQPVFSESAAKHKFELLTGTERKSTGSYYTPPELVNELIQSALVPVIQDRLKEAKTPADKEQQLLALTVCDPACGSGHFLLAAARRIGKDLAIARTGDEEPAPEQMRLAIRDVITHCIYGVDKNPLAVDLCKVALWLEGHTTSKPLTFLDHRIRCGDSLVGVFNLSVLKEGIPDDAYTAVTSDDKAVAKGIKTQNKREREHRQLGEFDVAMGILTKSRQHVNSIADDSPEDIRRKKELFSAFQQEGTAWCKDKTACDLWTAAFFVGLTKEHQKNQIIPTTNTIREYLAEGVKADHPQVKNARGLANKYRFFHWPLEFPEVFGKGGFDCILGNPPWETIEFKEKEFFSTRNIEISNAPNGAARKRLIQKLESLNYPLFFEYQTSLSAILKINHFIQNNGRFAYTTRGKINTYSLFAELYLNLISSYGRSGLICPPGIASDETNKIFFENIMKNYQIVSLFAFINENFIFQGVLHNFRFCLLTMAGASIKHGYPDFVHECEAVSELKDRARHFSLTMNEVMLLNPNTLTAPVFRTNRDAEMTKKIYQRVPVLNNKLQGKTGNLWEISFKQGLFNMTSDSHLFCTHEQMETEGFTLIGNRFLKGEDVWQPLYEAKMIDPFNHRYGSFNKNQRSHILPESSISDYLNPDFCSIPYYWVKELEIINRCNISSRWFLVFRNIISKSAEVFSSFAILPFYGLGHSGSIVLFNKDIVRNSCYLLSLCNSMIFGYIVKQKLSGANFSFFVFEQLPVIPPNCYTPSDLTFIVPRVLELTYTAWDIKAFADDVWRDADDAMKALLRQQWEENKVTTGGHPWAPPEWAEIEPDGISLPPFKWDEDRRAVLRAELDAVCAQLYGLTRDELRYILDPCDVYGPDFPGETFRILKDKEIRKYGEYRTKRLILEAWDNLVNTNQLA